MKITVPAVFKYLDPIGESGKLASLDGLRAFAILFVLIRHAATGIRDNFNIVSTDGPLWSFALNGWLGVDLFFVLSGFLVGYHLIRYWPSSHRYAFIKSYWLKRLLRIFPLYYAIILIVVFELIPFYDMPSLNIIQSLRVHFIFMQDYFIADLLVPLWSLATEEKFYFIAPFIVWVMVEFKVKYYGYIISAFVLLIVISMIVRSVELSDNYIVNYSHFFWSYRSPFHFSFQGLLMGLIVAYLNFNNIKFGGIEKRALILSSSLLIIVMLTNNWMSGDINWQIVSLIILVINIIFSFILYVCVSSESVNMGWMSGSFLRLFSKLAYSLYLVHFLFIPWAVELAKKLSDDQSLSIFIFIMLYVCFSIIFAYILHVSIEKPFLLVKDYITIHDKVKFKEMINHT